MAIISGEFKIQKTITEKGEEVVMDIKILDHKLNSIHARYDVHSIPNFFGELMSLINDYINEDVKNIGKIGE